MKTSQKGKYIVYLISLVFAFSCKEQKTADKQAPVIDTVYVTDTIYIQEQNDTLSSNHFETNICIKSYITLIYVFSLACCPATRTILYFGEGGNRDPVTIKQTPPSP